MSEYKQTVPEVLQPYYTDLYQLMHESYQQDTVDTINARRAAQPVVIGDESTASAAVIRPHLSPIECDPNAAIATPQPFAINVNGQMYTLGEMVANVTGRSNYVFPNQMIGMKVAFFNRQERAQIAKGDNTPIVNKQIQRLLDDDIERLSIFGFSQGAGVGLSLADKAKDYFDIEDMTIAEAVPTEERTILQLAKAFGAAGPALNGSINAAAIPALSEFGKSNPGLANKIRQQLSLGRYAAGIALPSNRALLRSFQHDNVDERIEAVLSGSDANIVYARMADSAILGQEAFDATVERFGSDRNFDSITIPGYGHEAGDNVVLMGLLAARTRAMRG